VGLTHKKNQDKNNLFSGEQISAFGLKGAYFNYILEGNGPHFKKRPSVFYLPGISYKW